MAPPLRFRTNAFDRFLMQVSPGWAYRRVRARALAGIVARHYEAADVGRRTSGWTRVGSDANAANGRALAPLRDLARELDRNNAWVKEGVRVLVDHTVGWGIMPKPTDAVTQGVFDRWKAWSESTQCDSDGRLSFYGLQALTMRTVVVSGEALIRRRGRYPEDGFAIPMQVQVLEPDFIDTAKDNVTGPGGGPIVQGIEFNRWGQRVAYWLFPEHPGSGRPAALSSRRVLAEDIIHVFLVERPGQVRGVTWFAPTIATVKDFDEYEDATLMQAKVAALFAAVITDDGQGPTAGEPDKEDSRVEVLEPGMILRTPPGGDAKFGVPPVASENGFSTRQLRRVAAGIGTTHEDLTGDYSQVNYSSARMGRNKHNAHIHGWRWNMLIPVLCAGVWNWAMQAATLTSSPAPALWTPPPAAPIDPEKEGLAGMRSVRSGQKTFSGMVREQGLDPDVHFDEYAKDLERLDKLGIKLDSDVRAVSQAGLTQERVGGKQQGGGDE